MRQRDSKMSPKTFEGVLARAIEIQEQEKDALDPARAREIAAELGVQPAAWDAALRQRNAHTGRLSVRLEWPRIAVATGAGGILGTLLFTVGPRAGLTALALASGVIVVGFAVSVYEAIRSGLRHGQASLAGWWLGVAAGLIIGIGGIPQDVGTFVALSWTGSSAAVALVTAIWRRLRKADT